MNEGDASTPSTDAWGPVDELGALSLQMGERRFDVRNGVRHVMQTFTPSVEKRTDGRVRRGRLQQLHEGPPDRDHRLLDTLFFDDLPIQGLDSIQAPVSPDGRVQILHGDGDVVEIDEQHPDIVPVGTIGSWEPSSAGLPAQQSGNMAVQPPHFERSISEAMPWQQRSFERESLRER